MSLDKTINFDISTHTIFGTPFIEDDIKLSPKSLKLYFLCLNKLNIPYQWLESPKINSIVKKVKSIENLSTKNNYVFAVAWFLKYIGKENDRISWLSLFENDIKKRRDRLLDNTWAGSERYRDLTMDVLKERWINTMEKINVLWDLSLSIRKNDEKFENRFVDKFQKLFLISLYLFGEPYRNNFISMKYYEENLLNIEEPLLGNYLLKKNNGDIKIIINDFKTKKKYKQLIKNLESESRLAWFKFKEIANIKHGEFIFRQRTQNGQNGIYSPTSSHVIQIASKVVLDLHLSSNDFRHLYVIDLMKSEEYQNMTAGERIKKHEAMGHTINTAQIYNRV